MALSLAIDRLAKKCGMMSDPEYNMKSINAERRWESSLPDSSFSALIGNYRLVCKKQYYTAPDRKLIPRRLKTLRNENSRPEPNERLGEKKNGLAHTANPITHRTISETIISSSLFLLCLRRGDDPECGRKHTQRFDHNTPISKLQTIQLR